MIFPLFGLRYLTGLIVVEVGWDWLAGLGQIEKGDRRGASMRRREQFRAGFHLSRLLAGNLLRSVLEAIAVY